MFKQVKSAVFWYYLIKFRRRVVLIAFLLLTALFANFIYNDVVEYLKLKNRLEFLELALILKWFFIFFNLTFSVYLLVTIFKKEEEKKNIKPLKPVKKAKENQKPKETAEVKKEDKFSQREKDLLYKKSLRTKADILINKHE